MAPNKWAKAPYQITDTTEQSRIVVIGGRVRWAIEELRKTGRAGRTGREALGPRWVAYILAAKHTYSIPTRDKTERHGGDQPGHHERWWLDCDIRPVDRLNRGAA